MVARGLDGLSRNAALVLLVIAAAAAAAVLLSFAAGLAPFQDSWEFLMNRRDPSVATLLDPHNEHIVLIPVLVQQLLLRLFGMDSTTPEFVVLVALLLGTAVLLFVYVRRRLGPWPALIAAVLMLFLGPAWQDLLWPFQIGFVGSALCGVAMLLALEAEEERWDLAAGVLLALSIAFSSLGLAFAAAAVVDVVQHRRDRGLRRAYLAAVPLLLYGLWYLGWGRDAESHLSVHNVLVSPRYLVEGLRASVDALLALATIADEAVGRSDWGWAALIVLVALLGLALVRRRGVPPRAWPAAAAMAAFWLLAAFSTIPGREAYSSRYLYVGALFVLLVVADLLEGLRFPRWTLPLAGAATLAVVVFNLQPLREGRDFFKSQTVLTRADLGAIEIAARTVEPSFRLPPEIAGTPYLNEIEAADYLRAVREYGSPAYSPAQLARAPEPGRVQADVVLAHALPLAIEEGAAARPPGGACLRLGEPGAPPSAPLAPGVSSVHFAAGAPGTIGLRRFAATYSLVTEGVAAGSTTKVYVPRDRARQPWRLEAAAPQGATVCR